MPPPRGGGALLRNLSDKNALFEPSAKGQNGESIVVENLDGTVQVGMSQEETQDALMRGTLEFDAENDPVIYTTDYGLDIKWHLTGYLADASTLTTIESGKFSGYAYIEAAGVKWAIVGRSSNITELLCGQINIGNVLSKFASFSGYDAGSLWDFLLELDDSTDAGASIYNVYQTIDSYAYAKPATGAYANLTTIFPNAKEITDTSVLATNEVLCFAQGIVQSSITFNASTSSNRYSSSNLKSTIDKWYDDNLKSSWDSYIVSKTLKTTYSGGSADPCTAKLFPLAGASSSESFYYGTYMSAGKGGNMAQSVHWWLRSGDPATSERAYIVHLNGTVYRDDYTFCSVDIPRGVRPAFVLKI